MKEKIDSIKEVMEDNIEKLKNQRLNKALFDYLEKNNISISPNSYLGKNIQNAVHNGNNSISFNKLINLDEAFNNINLNDEHIIEWLKSRLKNISDKLNSVQYNNIKTNSNVAEIEAFGHLNYLELTKPIKVNQNEKTPDFISESNIFIEVYCPQESQKEIKKIGNKLKKQTDFIKIPVSHLITGSNNLALQYPTNKTIDKILNSKRSNNQCQPNQQNILWLDVKQSLELTVETTLPFISKNHADHTWIGCFGLWHAFYGEKHKSIFTPNRTTLRFISEHSKYLQQKNGIFRERKELSAALISLLDGIVLFENPWTTTPLKNKYKKKLIKLFRFRPEYSFWSFDNCYCKLNSQIENELLRFNWLIEI